MENILELTQEKTLTMFEKGILADSGDTIFEKAGYASHTGLQLGSCDYWPYYETYHHYYPFPTVVAPNKTETAFKVVKVLIDKRLAKIQTVRQFVEVMDEIVKVL